MALLNDALLPLQSGNGGNGAALLFLLLALLIALVTIAGMWRIFQKADEPGWAAIIPIYNTYVLIKIGGNPWWYLLLYLVPLVNLIVAIKVFIDVARAFGRGTLFGLGMAFLTFLFVPLLGFGDDQYRGAPR
ncbi:DUF5684 domain-containing protein [Salarchaeum sp. III]|uniref:DUF5684 domain-containing protein n=1 Tax=Salarchaeum sp. III TaxID=3107927 RepID=UPI002ED974A0